MRITRQCTDTNKVTPSAWIGMPEALTATAPEVLLRATLTARLPGAARGILRRTIQKAKLLQDGRQEGRQVGRQTGREGGNSLGANTW